MPPALFGLSQQGGGKLLHGLGDHALDFFFADAGSSGSCSTGVLLDHEGAAGDAERNSARVFGADQTYYVLNGTSTVNQIIWRSQVLPGDIALVDRNCHKSIEQGLINDDCEINMPTLTSALKDLDIHFGPAGTYMGERCIEREIRSLAVADKVSPIATVPQVRNYVDMKLREFGKNKRVVMDGRDIGTTVFPDAEIKIFMTADPMIRAKRRAAEMEAKGEKTDINDVLRNLQERDYIDSHREASPLSKADDAIVLDNSQMTMDDQMVWLKNIIAERFGC
mgnify:CR=1 FL=1